MKNVYDPKQDKLQITLCESNGFGRFLNVSLIQILTQVSLLWELLWNAMKET